MINQAIIFAAGKGERMMPLTANKPKPMLEVLDKPLLGHSIAGLDAAGVQNIVVNAHYCAEAIEGYVPAHIKLSKETELLETGGAVKKALADGLLSRSSPFIAVNSDVLCTNGPTPAIERMNARWNELGDAVDVLLLIIPKAKAWGHDSEKADFNMDEQGRLVRLSSPEAEYVNCSIMIMRPKLYDGPELGKVFSNRDIYDNAQKAGRLYGLVHDGGWFHFSTPRSLELFHQQAATVP